MRWIIFLLLLLMVPLSCALEINIGVNPELEGVLSNFEFTSGPVQSFSVTWDNIGSISCISRARIDFKRNGELVHQVYSEESKVPTGKSVTWNLYSSLPKGNYTFYLFIDHCYGRFAFGPYNLTVVEEPPVDNWFEAQQISNTKDTITISVKSKQDTGPVVVVAEKYPQGWMFQSSVIEKLPKDVSKEIQLHYRPQIWKEENITLSVISLDGRHKTEKQITLKEYPTLWDWLVFMFRLLI